MAFRRSFAPSEEEAFLVYSECMKLSAAGKINVKNAFGLRLIDYMRQLANQKQINFKQIGCALDAGAKIYGHRVDYVQAEAQKVAKGLVIVLNDDAAQAGDDMDIDDDGKTNPDGETLPKRRKVERKKAKTISADISSLNTTKVESNLPPDPLLALLSSFDVGNVNSLLMSNLPLNDDGLLLLSSVEIPPVDSKINDVTLDGSMIEGLLSQKPLIIPKLSKFEFLNRGEELDNSISTMRAGTQSDKSSFTLDGVHSLSQPFEASLDPREAVDDDIAEHHDAGGFFDDHHSIDSNDDHESVKPDNNLQQSVAHYSMRTVDSDGFDKLVKALSDQPSDYTYFNRELLKVWAGPEHWKLKPQTRRGMKEPSNPAITKSSRKVRNQFTEINFKQKLAPAGYHERLSRLISFQTVMKWPDRILPSDVAYEPMNLIKPFLLEGTTFSLVKKTGIDPNGGSNFNDNDSDGRSSPGCDAGMDNHYDDEFAPTQECFGTQAYNHDLDSGTYAPFSGDNLVDEPFAVSSTALPFSTHAKKIDVKRLKREMWTIVTSDTVNKSQTSETSNTSNDNSSAENRRDSGSTTANPDDEENQEKPLPFTEVYKILPTRVGSSMANNLSVPIAFVALLHLTNEKNLKLQGKPDLSDFFIQTESLTCS